ncbi:hypothetical protein H6G36_28280 [Anabaena minutissima FACHB-250]|nr:hypothetical protein [Anabaena minutissima FACHB-250]
MIKLRQQKTLNPVTCPLSPVTCPLQYLDLAIADPYDDERVSLISAQTHLIHKQE